MTATGKLGIEIITNSRLNQVRRCLSVNLNEWYQYIIANKGPFILSNNIIIHYVGFEVFTAVTMTNAVFWDVAPCGFMINLRFGGTSRFHLQGRKNNASEEKC
jgi:hypothetical protein